MSDEIDCLVRLYISDFETVALISPQLLVSDEGVIPCSCLLTPSLQFN